jgi:hypothetical protein
VTRNEATTPAQGSRPPWRFNQNYALDKALLIDEPIDDGTLKLTSSKSAPSAEEIRPRAAISNA